MTNRPWVIVNEMNDPVAYFLRREHAEDWHRESGEGARYRIFKEGQA